MNRHTVVSLIALAAAALPLPASAQTPSGGFRLPTPTPTPTDIQGPVDPDAPILTRPRDVTETPTPRPTSTPAPTPTPTAALPGASPASGALPPPRNSSLPPRFTPPAAQILGDSAAADASQGAFPAAPVDDGATPPTALPTIAAEAAPGDESNAGWLYALGGLAVIGLAGGAVAMARRRRRREEDFTPTIAAPRVAAPPAPPPVAEPPLAPTAAPLMIEARAIRLARSMLNATLSYELHVTNRGGLPLENVRVGADLVTAHARVPTEQQLADPALPLAPIKQLARLDPGEHVEFSGELRLPVAEIRPIPHGQAVVYVPLLRVKAEAAGVNPVARTFVVGLLPSGAARRLQPFRLDELPQTYHAVGQRALD